MSRMPSSLQIAVDAILVVVCAIVAGLMLVGLIAHGRLWP